MEKRLIDFPAVQSEIDANLATEFAAVKALTKDDDTPASNAAIAAIEAHFNADVGGWQDVQVEEFAAHLELESLIEKVELASQTHNDQAVRVVAAKIVRIASLSSAVQVIGMVDAARRAKLENMLALLVTGGVWTQSEADGVLALAKITRPRWQSFGGKVGRGVVLLLRSGRA